MDTKNTLELKPEIEVVSIKKRMERLLAVYEGIEAKKIAKMKEGKKS